MSCDTQVYHSVYDTVVVCGGGSKVATILGGIQYLYEQGCFKKASAYVGTSIGAIISLLLSVGMSPIDILQSISKVNISNLNDMSIIKSLTTHFFSKYGLFTVNKLRDCVIDILKDAGAPSDLTLAQHHDKYKAVLCVVAYNITHNQCEYITYETYPDLKCIDAVCMSSCIPLYFIPVEYEGMSFIDGGMFDNFPIEYAVQKYGDAGKKCIGFSINDAAVHKYDNILEYIYYLTHIMTRTHGATSKAKKYIKHPNVHIVMFKNENISLPLNSVGDIKYVSDLFIQGYNMIRLNKLKLE